MFENSSRITRPVMITALMFAFVGCAPRVGSDAWCEKMKETEAGDWSANDAAAYAKNCILK